MVILEKMLPALIIWIVCAGNRLVIKGLINV